MADLAPFTRARVERLAIDALRRADALGVIPTPLEALRGPAGIVDVRPMPELPQRARATARKLLGATWFEERAIFVERAQGEARRRFTEAHELMHALCPWHAAALREDTSAELFRATAVALEAEANFGAGVLLHQGELARRLAGPPALAEALRLAAAFGASAHATLHEYVRVHPAPVAVLVAGRFPRRDGSLPVWRGIASPAFAARLPPPAAVLPRGIAAGTALREVIEAARHGRAATGARVPWRDRAGGRIELAAEAHDNRHVFLALLAEPAA
jgi:hypothetical protein